MSPIARLPDGRIITKGGKPSCSCCADDPCNPDGTSKTGEHVFDENGLYLCGPGFDLPPDLGPINYHDINTATNNRNNVDLRDTTFPQPWPNINVDVEFWLACYISPGGYQRTTTRNGGVYYVRPQISNPPAWWEVVYLEISPGNYTQLDTNSPFKLIIETELWVGYTTSAFTPLFYPWLRNTWSSTEFIPHKKIKTITTVFGENSAFPGFFLGVEDLVSSVGAATAHLACRSRAVGILPHAPTLPFYASDYGITAIPGDHRIANIRFTYRWPAIGFYRAERIFPPTHPETNHFVYKVPI